MSLVGASISGTSDVAGVSSFDIRVTDASGATDTKSFSLTVDPAAAASLSYDVQPSNAVAGVAIAPAVRLKVTDSFGNPISGASVAVVMSGGGTLSGTLSQDTDVAGLATFADLSMGLVGTKQLHATSGSLGPVSSANFDITAAAAASLSYDVQPSNAVAGVAIAPAVRLKVMDSFGNPISGASVAVVMSGGGTLSGTLSQNTDGAGLATFGDLSVDLVGTKQLHATSGSLGPVSSSNFDITAAAAANLSYDVQPSNAVAGVAISPAVLLKVTDGFGNPISGASVAVVMSGGGTLSGTLSHNTDGAGLATFGDLSVDIVGTKQLHATSGSLGPVSSANFDITAAEIGRAHV